MNKDITIRINEIEKKFKVSKANFLTRISYRLKELEQKLLLIIISKISPKDKDFHTYEIPVKIIAEILGRKNDFYDEMKKMTFNLLKKPFKYINEKGQEVQQNWFSVCKYGDGIASFRFDPELKPYLLELKNNFTTYQLSCAIDLKSAYSIRLYEIFKSCEGLKKADFYLDELRYILGLEKSELKDYFDFKRKVLFVAQKELSTKTDISFTFKEIKRVRKVNIIRFLIVRDYEKGEEIKQSDIFHLNPTHYELMQKYNQTEFQARRIVSAYDESYIKDKIEQLEYLLANKPERVDGKGKYLYNSIFNNWRDDDYNKYREEKNKEKIEKNKKIKEGILKKYEKDVSSFIEQYKIEMKQNEIEELEKQVNIKLKPILDMNYNYSETTLNVMKKDFENEIIANIIKKEHIIFDTWLRQNGYLDYLGAF